MKNFINEELSSCDRKHHECINESGNESDNGFDNKSDNESNY